MRDSSIFIISLFLFTCFISAISIGAGCARRDIMAKQSGTYQAVLQIPTSRWYFAFRMKQKLDRWFAGTGYDTEILLAQICLETGYGTSRMYKDDHNPFAIKNNGEYRKYCNNDHCFADFYFIMGKYPKAVECLKNGNIEGYLAELEAGGWAEDKNYTKLVMDRYKYIIGR